MAAYTIHNIWAVQRQEVERLVAYFLRLGVRTSSEVSYYIRRFKLGRMFPHIAGKVRMYDSFHSWNFYGGISPDFFAEFASGWG